MIISKGAEAECCYLIAHFTGLTDGVMVMINCTGSVTICGKLIGYFAGLEGGGLVMDSSTGTVSGVVRLFCNLLM
jgi:hypothetical protein